MCYNNSPDSCARYGRLYPWQVAMAVDTSFARASRGSSDSLHHQGVCPAGWRIPSPGDWATLVRVAGNSHDDSAAIRLKADSLWPTKGNNASGFNALPAGQRNASKSFEQLGGFADFWLSTEENATRANVAYLQNSNETKSSSSYKIQAFSVRCILE